MGLLKWAVRKASGLPSPDETCADEVRRYLATHGIESEHLGMVKGEQCQGFPVRVYFGTGIRDSKQVGFYVYFTEAFGVLHGITLGNPELASHAHHWRSQWIFHYTSESLSNPDLYLHNPEMHESLYRFILKQMAGDYQDLDAPPAPSTQPIEPEIPRYNEANIARSIVEADKLLAEHDVPYRIQEMAKFIDTNTGSKLASATIYSNHDGHGDPYGNGGGIAIGFAEKCLEIMVNRQKIGEVGEAKADLDAGVESLRAFLFDLEDICDGDKQPTLLTA